MNHILKSLAILLVILSAVWAWNNREHQPTPPTTNRVTNLPPAVTYKTKMFYRAGDSRCEWDWRKICLAGESNKITLIEISAYPRLAEYYEISDVPTYIITKHANGKETIVFRTTSLQELDRFTRGRR